MCLYDWVEMRDSKEQFIAINVSQPVEESPQKKLAVCPGYCKRTNRKRRGEGDERNQCVETRINWMTAAQEAVVVYVSVYISESFTLSLLNRASGLAVLFIRIGTGGFICSRVWVCSFPLGLFVRSSQRFGRGKGEETRKWRSSWSHFV